MSTGLILITLAAGLGVGFASALLGIGGSPVMIPFMVFVLELNQHVAEGTSLLVIVPTAIVGMLAHRRRGFVSLRAAAILGLAGVGGAFAGARIALALDADVLTAAFGAFLVVVGLGIIVSGVRALATED